MTNPQFPNESQAAVPAGGFQSEAAPATSSPAASTFAPLGGSPSVATPARETNTGRPSGLVLAGAGSLVAVLAFLGGMAVGHAWDGSSTTPTQFGGPGGGGLRQFPGNGQGGQVPPGQTQPQQGQQGQPG
ncbi:hypothetical protein E1263_03330 [Kribbella antibiotica]|uniref:Uncharacterized protein n=1 Tax=Kribbella antibiotica TaxID=190195 RepID=A0A4R4ZW60_9ACTN|nr:hypothetical protein [Kribbella antibiotica]TDD62484.1 hypothetical protein E1263_03330 [Kribbella antibiotica]